MDQPSNSISVLKPLALAFRQTGYVLFRTGNWGKWLLIPFILIPTGLQEMGQQSASQLGFQTLTDAVVAMVRSSQNKPGATMPFQSGAFNFGNVTSGRVLLAIAIVIVVVTLQIFFVWLSTRARFVLVDMLAGNRAAIREPWTRHGPVATRYVAIRICAWLAATIVVSLAFVLGLFIAWNDLTAGEFGGSARAGIIVFVIAFLMASFMAAMIENFLDALLIPYGLINRCGPGEAIQAAWTTIVKPHPWKFFGYCALRMLNGFTIVTLSLVTAPLACCLPFVPVIGTYVTGLMLLPLVLVNEHFVLAFSRQFGTEWNVWIDAARNDRCRKCEYDLSGCPDALVCPECGNMTPSATLAANAAVAAAQGTTPG